MKLLIYVTVGIKILHQVSKKILISTIKFFINFFTLVRIKIKFFINLDEINL